MTYSDIDTTEWEYPNEYIKLSEVDWLLSLLSEELIEKLSTEQFKHNDFCKTCMEEDWK